MAGAAIEVVGVAGAAIEVVVELSPVGRSAVETVVGAGSVVSARPATAAPRRNQDAGDHYRREHPAELLSRRSRHAHIDAQAPGWVDTHADPTQDYASRCGPTVLRSRAGLSDRLCNRA